MFGKIEGREETVSMSLKTLAVYTIVLCFSTSDSRQRVAPGSGTHKLTHLSPFNAVSKTLGPTSRQVDRVSFELRGRHSVVDG